MAVIVFTAAAVSEEVRAKLTPVFVTFHLGGEENALSSDDTKILNYKGQLFVPLRSFANEMGGSVYYTAPVNGERAKVDIYYEDDRDMTLKDKEGYVSLANLDVRFALDDSMPGINGTVKINKVVPKDRDIVISVLDSNGNTLGVSGAIQSSDPFHLPISQIKQGNIINFGTYFPYMSTPDKYTLKVEVVKKTDWAYSQGYIGTVSGAGGFNGFPLNPAIHGTNHQNKLGESTPIVVNVINIGKEDSIVITKPFTLSVEISDSNGKIIRTLTTKPFQGEILWRYGSIRTTIPWDQKDSSGKKVTKGEYQANLLTTVAEGHYKNKPDKIIKFDLLHSMQASISLLLE
ncbi:hypothetical protein [Paenibacillus paeoniae]|uniref:Copper amine oxidase-like N-terminal domain-containing protein n=1 Tax=Paenibacillus paeoniae TaxID=2292705 RepID=A0A371PLE7_9BACL|nr:hypothetical protein [Paenibacillus paeoniae]REK77032.1 hypothetical protein DX130_08480 [Paenibacillus paeoniae]